jgi:HlyD family type I secretion membrane fusion protein
MSPLDRPRRDSYTDPRRPAMVGLGIVGAFLGALILWSTVAPVAGAAVANGNLQVRDKRQAVQHPYGGVIKELLVREGEMVKKGQTLLTLSDTEPRSNLDVLVAEQDALLAQDARLIAERDGRSEPDFGAKLMDRSGEPGAVQAMANEKALMTARAHTFETQKRLVEQKSQQLREQIQGLQAQADGLAKQKTYIEEEAKGVSELLEKCFAPKTRLLALQRTMTQLDQDRAARLADIASSQQQIAQNDQEAAKLDRDRVKEITDQLRTTHSKLAELAPKIAAAQDVLRRTDLTAPATGAVVGLDVFTEGGVIKPGAKVMDIIPSASPLIAEAKLRLSDVDQVVPGRTAEVRLTSINSIERPVLYGTIRTVSADRITDEKSGQAYYAIQVALNADDVQKSNIDLQAGMPVEVIVPTKPRTLVQYLVSPLRDEIAGAFRER